MTVDIGPMIATPRAQWLPPSHWPAGSEHLFTQAPFRVDQQLPVISRYEDVRAALLDTQGTFSRVVPYTAIPDQMRHRTLFAAWGLDGAEHRRSRSTLTSINTGSTPQARALTRELCTQLTRQLMQEAPPWDLSRVIYEVSMQVVVQHTMQAPMLLPHARRLRELTREHVSAEGGFFGIQRDTVAEDILATVVEQAGQLTPGSLSAHLVEMHRAHPESFTVDNLVGQLWLLAVSAETQATQAASLIGMLLETDEFAYARSILGDDEAFAALIDESGRRGIGFPASLLVAVKPFTLDGQTLDAGRPCLISYAAANLDPEVFADPLTFNPRRARSPKHLAFGVGDHRCQGEIGATQFVADVTASLLAVLPPDLQLHDGLLHRETGISMSVACLPVAPIR
jgi:cytochrome P450